MHHRQDRDHKPTRAILLARISEDRTGPEEDSSADDRERFGRSITNQKSDGYELAARLGWGIGPEATHVIVEDSVSAFKRKKTRLPDGTTALRTVRPGFRRALALLASGEADGLIVYDLDRTARDPRDLEDLIDVIETRGVPVRSVTGSLSLATDAEITMARVMVAVANKSSRDTSRRVARAAASRAHQGRPSGGGYRAFGYDTDWNVIPAEAAIIREIYERICCKGEWVNATRKHGDQRGHSLERICLDLNARGIPTVSGKTTWQVRTLTGAITKPAIAGLRVYKGKVVGKAVWEPILTEAEWAELCETISDRAMVHGAVGKLRVLKRWASQSLHCYACGKTLHGWSGGSYRRGTKIRQGRYWCATPKGGCGKTSVNAEDTHELLGNYWKGIVSRPEWSAYMNAQMQELEKEELSVGATDLKRQIAEDERQRSELNLMWARKELDLASYREMKSIVDRRLAALKTRADTPTGRTSLLPPKLRALITGQDTAGLVALWDNADPAGKRTLLKLVIPMGFTVGPHSGRRPLRWEPERFHVRTPEVPNSTSTEGSSPALLTTEDLTTDLPMAA
ncbi:recombinase family protein [Streptomyces sp. JNUCC 64]